MLALERKTGEALVINGAVTVHILAVDGERVTLGIFAPPDVVIVRGELINAELQQQQLYRKRRELARETDPRKREKLAQSLARLQQSMRLIQPTITPASTDSPGPAERRPVAGVE